MLTPCYSEDGYPDGTFGVFDPSEPSLPNFLSEFFQEVFSRFGDDYVHLGADEAFYGFKCWLSNPRIQKLMKTHNITSGNDLQKFYTELQLESLEKINGYKRSFIFWEDVFTSNVKLNTSNTVVQVWNHNQTFLAKIVDAGFKAIYSQCWYLNYIRKVDDWKGNKLSIPPV